MLSNAHHERRYAASISSQKMLLYTHPSIQNYVIETKLRLCNAIMKFVDVNSAIFYHLLKFLFLITISFFMMMKERILIIGLGPHCKRIYIRGLKRLQIAPVLIVDLESKRRDVEAYVQNQGISAELFFVPDDDRDADTLQKWVQEQLDQLIIKQKITHAIISTEPKAHYAYLQYLISRRIPTLADKPITAPVNVANDEEQARKIYSEYCHLVSLVEQYGTQVVVQCQRRYDPRYQWIISYVKELIKKYSVPVSHVHITHCDGSLNMPNEFFSRENHPYKYGYGKIFHSGYHFIDLLTLLLSYDALPLDKRPNQCQISSIHYSPHDQLFALDEAFYKDLFKEEGFSTYYKRWRNEEYRKMGELDILALLEFSRDRQVVTTCSLNLLQSGFTRRAWSELPMDTYKGNGRVRHETVSLQLGPLMNIQVHSYQAHEVKERGNHTLDHSAAGGLEHFDIHIFRNSDLIGGPAHEIIKGNDLFPRQVESTHNFIGYNEHARDTCLAAFLNGKGKQSTLLEQKLTIDLVTHTYLSMCRRRNGEAPIAKFQLTKEKPLTNKEQPHDAAEFYSSLSCRH